MPRKIVPISSEFPYSINARCINKEWFSIPLDEIWEVMENYLYFLHIAYNFKIKSFVLMSNHFHLITQAPLGNLSEGMNYFMRETSRVIGKRASRINQIYGARFFRSMISKEIYFQHAYKYAYRNPVEAGIVKSPFDYKYSTLPGLIGKNALHIPIDYDHLLMDSFESTVEWLNKTPDENHRIAIKNALRRSEFKIPRCIKTNKKHPLEIEKY